MTESTYPSASEAKWKPPFAKLPRIVCKHGERGRHLAFSAKWRRQNTMYVDDRANWVCVCNSCFQENEAYWRDMWSDYYSGLL